MILHFFRIPRAMLGPIYLRRGSRKLRKWLKKNKKHQDPNLHPYTERWSYIRKKVNGMIKRIGVEVVLVGEENILKGGMWITPNHSSNFDGFFIIQALGHKTGLVSVARENLQQKKMVNGYFLASDSFFLDRTDIRQNLSVLKAAANYSKNYHRGIVIFPEGTRSITTEMIPFKAGTFKFPQQYGLPIVPVSITGTLQAKKWYDLKNKKVTVTVHKPIKVIEHIKIPREIIAKRIFNIIQDDLIKYEKNLSPSEKKNLENLKRKAIKDNEKKKRNLEIEQELKLKEREKEQVDNEYSQNNN